MGQKGVGTIPEGISSRNRAAKALSLAVSLWLRQSNAMTLPGSNRQRLTPRCRERSIPQVTSSVLMSGSFQEAGVDITLSPFTVHFSSPVPFV